MSQPVEVGGVEERMKGAVSVSASESLRRAVCGVLINAITQVVRDILGVVIFLEISSNRPGEALPHRGSLSNRWLTQVRMRAEPKLFDPEITGLLGRSVALDPSTGLKLFPKKSCCFMDMLR